MYRVTKMDSADIVPTISGAGAEASLLAGWKDVCNQRFARSLIPAAAGAAPRVVAVSPARRTALATRRSTTQVSGASGGVQKARNAVGCSAAWTT
jgi:hypothetical protein